MASGAQTLFTAEGILGIDNRPLVAGVRESEKVVRDSVQRIEQQGKQIKLDDGNKGSFGLASIGRAFAGIGTISGGLTLVSAATKIFKGDMEGAQASLERLPFGIGQVSRSFYELADAIYGASEATERFNKANRDAEERRARRAAELDELRRLNESGGEAFQMRLDASDPNERRRLELRQAALARVAAIDRRVGDLGASSELKRELTTERANILERLRRQELELDKKAKEEGLEAERKFNEKRSKLQAEHALQEERDAIQFFDAMRLHEEQSLRRDIEDQRIDAEANEQFFGKPKELRGDTRQIDLLRTVIDGVSNAAPSQRPADKDGQNEEIRLLRDMVTLLRNGFNVVAS